MMEDDDLRPLDASGEATPEPLLRALRALGRERPSAAALQATAARLQARIDAPLTGEVANDVTAPVRAGSKWFASKWAVAALTLGVGAGAVAYRTRTPEPVTPAQSVVAPQSTQAEPERSVPAAVVQPRSVPSVAAPVVAAAPAPREVAAPAVAALKPEAHAAKARIAARAASKSQAPQTSIAEVTAVEPAPEEATATRRASSQEAPPATELELMLKARRLAQIDPAGALPLLAEHARRFPRGALAPEREVLAIDALRALGKDALANERARKFRATYPNSVHTPALDRGAR